MNRQQKFNELLALAGRQAARPAVHSGKVTPGDIFVVLPPSAPGAKGGLDFLADAVAAGASSIVCSGEHAEKVQAICSAQGREVETVPVQDARPALGALARAYYRSGNPQSRLVGITGTNGKTTSAYLLEALFAGLGHSVAVLGTVNYRWPGVVRPAALTTPGCLELHEMFGEFNRLAVDTAVMEVSSHALDQQRVAGLEFSGALFTNLTQDHLDFHHDMETYYKAKARLFNGVSEGGFPLADKVRAINIDDPYGLRLLTECSALPGVNIAYGLGMGQAPGSRRLRGKILGISPKGLRLHMQFEGQEWELLSPLVGEFNAMNLLGVQAVALGLGVAARDLKILESLTGVPGRLERISGPEGREAFVDYSHTPDSIEKALKALRDAGFKRIVTVFGCGGDRDKTKRPIMGRAACAGSDVAVVTSDNPRTEEPMSIINDVLPGMAGCVEYYVEPDRKAATALAVSLMHPGDALLVAGKGHEDYQVIGKEKIYYSDQAVLRELFGIKG